MANLGLGGLWLFLIIVIAVSIGLAVGSIWLANHVAEDAAARQFTPTLSPFLTTVALVYGAVIGFTVVVAWEQFSSAEANVTDESSTVATMYRQTVAMPGPEQAKLRDLLRTYTTAVQSEWDVQDRGKTSETARSAITQMYRVLGNQQPDKASSPINGEFLGQLTLLTSQRNTRILDSRPRIPGLLWAGMLFGGVLLIGLMGFMHLESDLGHVILSSGVAVLLGLLMFIIFWLDRPFGRTTGVTPAPFEYSVQVFDGVDRGT